MGKVGAVEVHCPHHADELVVRWATAPGRPDVVGVTFPDRVETRTHSHRRDGCWCLARVPGAADDVQRLTPQDDLPHREYRFACPRAGCRYLLEVREDTISRVVLPIAASVHPHGGTFQVDDFDALLRRVRV